MSTGEFKPFKILFSGVGVMILIVLVYLVFHWIGGHVSWDIGPISDNDFKKWVVFLLVIIAVKGSPDVTCRCNCDKKGRG